METTVAKMSVNDLRQLISDVVDEKLAKYTDPDYGLELREDFIDRLRKQLEDVKNGDRGIPAEEVYTKLGLE